MKGFKNPSVFIDTDRLASKINRKGIEVDVKRDEKGVFKIKIYVVPNAKFKEPIVTVFKISKPKTLAVQTEIEVGNNADITFDVHALLDEGITAEHASSLRMIIGEGASVRFFDTHINCRNSFLNLFSSSNVVVGKRANYETVFKQVEGRAGNLNLKLTGTVGDMASATFETKVMGKLDDSIRIEDIIYLKGEGSKGLSKSRVVATDSTKSEFIGKVYGEAPHCRGHVDCSEIIRGRNAQVKSSPMIYANNELAKVTHEAAIGRLDEREIETLMAKGLNEDEAVDLIVHGLLS